MVATLVQSTWDSWKNQLNRPHTDCKQQVGISQPSADFSSWEPLRKSLTWSWMGWMVLLINQRLRENNQIWLSLLKTGHTVKAQREDTTWDKMSPLLSIFLSLKWKVLLPVVLGVLIVSTYPRWRQEPKVSPLQGLLGRKLFYLIGSQTWNFLAVLNS